MGFGTYFNAEIFLNHQEYKSMGELDEEIKDTQKMIAYYEQQISMYAASGLSAAPKTDDDGNVVEPISWMQCQLNNIFDEYKDQVYHLGDLLLLKEHFEERQFG